MTKPREFWINLAEGLQGGLEPDYWSRSQQKDLVHVIEKSAYDQMKQDYLDECKAFEAEHLRCKELQAKADKLAKALEWYASVTPWRDNLGNETQLAKQVLAEYRGKDEWPMDRSCE